MADGNDGTDVSSDLGPGRELAQRREPAQNRGEPTLNPSGVQDTPPVDNDPLVGAGFARDELPRAIPQRDLRDGFAYVKNNGRALQFFLFWLRSN